MCGTLPSGEKGVCYEDYLVPGEVLYYGAHWSHETQNLETPTMTITDTVRRTRGGGFEAIKRPA